MISHNSNGNGFQIYAAICKEQLRNRDNNKLNVKIFFFISNVLTRNHIGTPSDKKNRKTNIRFIGNQVQ